MRTPNSACQVCGTEFYRSPGKPNKTLTCSRECSATLRSEWMKGKGNHQFGIKGSLNSSHKKDYRVSSYGYLLLRNLTHPLRSIDDQVFAHRLVLEQHLRKYSPGSSSLIEVDGQQVLDPSVVVHHKDGNKLNNIVENLEALSLGDHTATHNADLIIERNSDGTFSTVRSSVVLGSTLRSHTFDAGQDIFSNEELTLWASTNAVVSTGLKVDIPRGYAGLLWSRSGLSASHQIETGAGCIDHGYAGEIKVVLYNHGPRKFEIKKGDRISQLLIVPVKLEGSPHCGHTKRGENGMGSTGVEI